MICPRRSRKRPKTSNRLTESIQLKSSIGATPLANDEIHCRKGIGRAELNLTVRHLTRGPRIAGAVDDHIPAFSVIENAGAEGQHTIVNDSSSPARE